MNELDEAALERLRAIVEKRIVSYERRQQMRPLFDAMIVKMDYLVSSQLPDITSGPTANSRLAVLALEKTVAGYPAREAEANERRKRTLDSARARTQALRNWLEDIS